MTTQSAPGTTKVHTTLTELQEERDALILSFPLARAVQISSSPAPTTAAPATAGSNNAAPEDTKRVPEKSASDSENAAAASASQPADASPSPEYAAQVLAKAREIVKEHIGLLHEYNEIRDIGYGLLGMIADQRGVRLVDAMEEFGVGSGD